MIFDGEDYLRATLSLFTFLTVLSGDFRFATGAASSFAFGAIAGAGPALGSPLGAVWGPAVSSAASGAASGAAASYAASRGASEEEEEEGCSLEDIEVHAVFAVDSSSSLDDTSFNLAMKFVSNYTKFMGHVSWFIH